MNDGQLLYCSDLRPRQQLDTGFESVKFHQLLNYVVTITLPLRCDTFTHKLTLKIISEVKALKWRQGQKHADSVAA